MQQHYERKFNEHGATPLGVDWGCEESAHLRYKNMLALLPEESTQENPVTLLDVGCGYGGLYQFSQSEKRNIAYTGLDICGDMIAFAQKNYPNATFQQMDFFNLPSTETYDYVLCNGILTQKLTATIREMDIFANQLIKKMFQNARRGIAFNLMSTRVNFMVDNLYYRNPIELFAYCFTELSPKIKLDHAYPLYEYTIYLYHE